MTNRKGLFASALDMTHRCCVTNILHTPIPRAAGRGSKFEATFSKCAENSEVTKHDFNAKPLIKDGASLSRLLLAEKLPVFTLFVGNWEPFERSQYKVVSRADAPLCNALAQGTSLRPVRNPFRNAN